MDSAEKGGPCSVELLEVRAICEINRKFGAVVGVLDHCSGDNAKQKGKAFDLPSNLDQ